MKTILLQLAIIFTLSFTAYKAQVSVYSFTQSSSSYGAPSTGAFVGTMPGSNQDDDVTNITLPFTFTFNGTPYTTIDVCANGYMSFNTLSGFEYQPISDNSTQDLIAPFGLDLYEGTVVIGDLTSGSNTITNCSSVAGFSVGNQILDYNGDFGSVNPTITSIVGNNIVLNINASSTNSPYIVIGLNGYIKQSVSGVAPNRIFEIEYRNFNRLLEDEVISFKVRLFETSNQIEFLYGTIIPGNDVFPPEVGLKGSTNSDFNSRKVSSSNTWATSVASTIITDVCDFDPSLFPVSGQSYKWTPVTCNTPTLTAVQNSSAICAGQSATITASGATTYSWVNGPASAQLTVSPNATTSYTVIGANSSCTSALVVTQTVIPGPTLSIAQSTNILCAGKSATLTASGASTYSWVNGPNTAQYVISPSSNTTYTLNGSNGNCSSSLSITQSVTICTGIYETNLLSKNISLYPNPFNENIQVKNNASTDANIYLIDALGKVIYTTVIKSDASSLISTEGLNKGIYFIQIKSGTESTTKKMIKE
jgi:hypothetical protein